MSNNETILALAEQAADLGKPEAERRTALKHIARLRDEPVDEINAVSVEDIREVAYGATTWGRLGLTDLSIRDTADAIRDGRMRRNGADRRW